MISLHQHTEYSLLDSIIRIPELVAKAKSYGHEALAITDHGSIAGWPEFHKECRKVGIKPILGLEAYFSLSLGDSKIYHMTLLARNLEGAHNLIMLHDMSYQIGFKSKPRITPNMLKDYGAGIIGLSGCTGSYMSQHFLETGEIDWSFYGEMQDVLDRFELEVMDNGIEDQNKINQAFLASGKPCVATMDCHVVEPEDYKAHTVALAIKYNKKISDITYYKEELYHFRESVDLPEEAMLMTHSLAADVEEFDLGYDQWHFPTSGRKIDPEGEYALLEARLETYLSELSMKDVLSGGDEKEYEDRLAYEFQVIKDNGFLEYFVTVADLCKKFDDEGAFRGWGRGSASGSLVSFLYGITKVDPIEWGLLFERFLNPDRISPPDIDLDFRPHDKHRAIQYFRDTFGQAYQIGAYATLGPKDVIQRAAKAMSVKTGLAKYVPSVAPVPNIRKLLESDKAFKKEADKNPEFRDVLVRIDGLKRNATIHASGVVVSDGHLPSRVNQTGVLKGTSATVWDMYALEDLKHIKFDILGLTNLDLLDRLQKSTGVQVEDINLEDRDTLDLLCEGRTLGVFQWEGAGYTRLIVDLHPDAFSELLDTNTLYRPGPMESGMTQQYLDRKHGREQVVQLHPSLHMKSQGLPFYQEDIMMMARDLAGFTMSQADTLRKAIGKKILDMFPALQAQWKEGCQKNGIDENLAMDLWEKVEKFARYTWNKAHAVTYTLISYWSAYYSAHHPVEFFTELFNISDSSERNGVIAAEARERGIPLLHPDFNNSLDMAIATPEGVLLGLALIKYVGQTTLDKLMEAQDRSKVKITKRMKEYMTKAGVFGADKTNPTEEMEALGFTVSGDILDQWWWAERAPNLGVVIEKHKITTKKGDPMGFLKIRFRNRTKSLTLFPSIWEQTNWKVGMIGIWHMDKDILRWFSEPGDLDGLRLIIEDPEGYMAFDPSISGKPNIYSVEGFPCGQVEELTEQKMRFIDENFKILEVL